MEGIEILGGRIRETAVPGSKKMHECNTRIKKKAGQPECRSGITEDGDGRSTSKSDGKTNEGPIVYERPLER